MKKQPEGPASYSKNDRLSHRLGTQTKQIERFMAQQRLPVSIKNGVVRRHWTEFNFGSQVGEAFSRLGQMKEELVAMLSVSDMRLGVQDNELHLRMRRNSSHPVDLLDLMTVQSSAVKPVATLGLDEEGHQVALDISNTDSSNILVAGVNGAGKSSLLRSLAVSLALTSRQSAVQMVVIAPSEGGRASPSRRRVLFPMNYLPHLLFPVATSLEEAAEAIEYLAEEALFRAEEGLKDPLLIVLIDDIDKILDKGDARLQESLAELLDAPNEAGIRLIMSAADVASPELLRLIKFNVPMRLVGRMADANRAFLISGEPDSGAENLIGTGDFLAISYANVTRFQAAYIDDYDLHLTLTEMHRPRRTVLLAQPLNPPESGEAEILRFTIDEQSGDVLLEDIPADAGQRPTEESIELIDLEELDTIQDSEEMVVEAGNQTALPEQQVLRPAQPSLNNQDDVLKDNMVLNSPSWNKVTAGKESAVKTKSESATTVLLDQEELTSVSPPDAEPEYDSYDDDWPLTGWDEEDNHRARHLH